MTKFRLFVIILLITALFLSSCEKPGGLNATDVLAKTVSALTSPPPDGRVYFSGAREDSVQFLSRSDAALIYTGTSNEDFDMLGLCESYAVYMSASLELFEIHILRSNSYSGAHVLSDMLSFRAAMLSRVNNETYFPQQLDGTPAGGHIETVVFQKGRYAVLAAARSAAEIEALIRSFI